MRFVPAVVAPKLLMPFLIEAQLPIEGRKPASPFRRLMIAQDTGTAIVGPARADLYWGGGEEASRIAGRIRHPGRFVMLLPREVDIAAVGRGALACAATEDRWGHGHERRRSRPGRTGRRHCGHDRQEDAIASEDFEERG
jgi:3D domain